MHAVRSRFMQKLLFSFGIVFTAFALVSYGQPQNQRPRRRAPEAKAAAEAARRQHARGPDPDHQAQAGRRVQPAGRPRLAGGRRARVGVEQPEEHRPSPRSEDQHRPRDHRGRPPSLLGARHRIRQSVGADLRRQDRRQGPGAGSASRTARSKPRSPSRFPTPKAASSPAPAASG